MSRLRALAAPLKRTPLHPQWLLGGRKPPRGIEAVAGRVLDVGAGDKWIQAHLPAQTEYVALDYPSTGRDLYHAKPDVFADAAHLPFADDVFDAVICLEVIEHVREPQRVFDEIARVLRPGGTAWLSMPFLYPIHDAPHDYQRFTEHGLRRSMHNSNLIVSEIDHELHALRAAGLVACLGLAGSADAAPRWQWPVLLPLTALAVLTVNLVSWFMSLLWPDWPALTAGYVVKAVKS